MGIFKMNKCRLTALLCACIILTLLCAGCKQSGATDITDFEDVAAKSVYSFDSDAPSIQRKLAVRNIDSKTFGDSTDNPRQYETDGLIKAVVIPHHTVAAELISGFFKMASESAGSYYETVVIVAPNHAGDLADVILSSRDWDINGGVACDTEITGAILSLDINGVKIIENHRRVEEDHSASVHIPYINYYLPDANVVPVLVSSSLTLDETMGFAAALLNIINESGKNVLLVCSIDFSHYLTPADAKHKDIATVEAIRNRDYKKIHDFTNDNIDSSASLIIFLEYLASLGISAEIIDNSDASEFLGPGVIETTSYFVIIGTLKDN
jgi:AmmeMemoRadiSam system protein B